MTDRVIRPADRSANIKYAVRDIVVLAKQTEATGKEMLYLNIGDPNLYDFQTPSQMIEETYKAMKANKNGYAPSSGLEEARQAVKREAERKGIKNIHDVFITTGGSEAIDVCLAALVNRGENFLTPTPGYPLYTAIASKIEAEMNPYYLNEENGWQPDIEDIKRKINDKTKAIVLINPNNPTGSNCSRETLQEIIDIAIEKNIVIFSDEIYDRLLFDGEEHISIAALNPDAPVITFGGLSKNYFAPGWRIGWGVVSGRESQLRDYIEAINKFFRARLSANHPEQYAIAPMLDGKKEHLQEYLPRLQRRRDITFEMLNTIPGISCVKPTGAFYAFPRIETDKDDAEFVKELIRETGVVVVPGSGFGQKPGTKHFRVVFLPPDEILTKAYQNIGEFWKTYQ
ncbi:aminotransferase class I/II-fold pyridoxal phosphate-dependent enzyme [Candidatus Gracilibacteria bacterium]|nr:aminotransferase class I/II-fold pyridoxal phosphate-dependent enzyme [Candidatus Gracilibacteria bacterium]